SLSVCDVGVLYFFFSSRRRHTRLVSDWSSDVCSSDLLAPGGGRLLQPQLLRFELGGDLGEHPAVHEGEEFGLVLSGRVECAVGRSEERRVGKEGRGGGWLEHWRRKGGEGGEGQERTRV